MLWRCDGHAERVVAATCYERRQTLLTYVIRYQAQLKADCYVVSTNTMNASSVNHNHAPLCCYTRVVIALLHMVERHAAKQPGGTSTVGPTNHARTRRQRLLRGVVTTR